MSQNGMNRRNFLKTGLTAGAAAIGTAAVHSGVALAKAPESKTISATGAIPERPFGKTGHNLPVLGHGGSAMVNSWAPAYGVELEEIPKRVEMVRTAYDMGIRYFDTARVYSESEGIMGEALADVRQNCFVATKMAMPGPDMVRGSVEKSLEELKMDYVDLMQIHSPAIERVGWKDAMKLHAELAKLRDEGLIRFIGLTTHVAFEDVFHMIDTGEFDEVLLARGYFRKGMDMMLSNPNIEWRERCVARAHELGMAIVAMKVMGLNVLGRGGHLVVAGYDEDKRAKLPRAAIRWVLDDERISMLNIGVSVPDDLVKNVETLKGDLKLSDEDRTLLADYTNQAYQSEYVKNLKVV
ncbi:MAG: aldo/keto reductase [Candidatus Hydrogenedentales bacterium]